MRTPLPAWTVLLALPLPAAPADAPQPSGAAPYAETSAVVQVTAPAPEEPLVTRTDPKAPRQPVPAHDGAEFLKTIPGFAVIRKGGTDGDPVLRGMAGSRLMILLDGEQILGGCGMRMDPPTAYIFPESYDRITVVKGPETVLYGPGSSAGTILFERFPHPFTEPGWRGTASVMGGSSGRQDEVLDALAGTSKFYVRGIGTHSHSGDYEDGSGQRIHSKYTRWSANAALGWTPTAGTRFELTGTRSDGRAAYADRTMDGAKFLRENVGFKFEAEGLSPLVGRLEGQVFRNYVDHVMDNVTMRAFVPTPAAPEPMASNPDRTTTGARVAATLFPGAATQWVLGLDGQQNRHTIRKSSRQFSLPEESLPRVEDARFRNAGVFTEVTRQLGEHNRLIGGLRADRWHAEDRRASVAVTMMATAPNPSAGQSRDETLTSGFARFERELSSRPLTAFAGVGHAERFPDYWELIAKESLGSVSAFATRPERTTQLDAGLIRKTGRVRCSVSAFIGTVRDFILIQSNVAKPSGATGTRMATVARNIDARTLGGEVAAEASFAQGFKADASLAFTRGENRTDDRPLAQIPPLESRIGLGYEGRDWSAGLLLRAVAAQERFAVNQGNIVGQDLGRNGGFAVFSLNGAWRPTRVLALSAGVDNVFNRTYVEHINRSAVALPGYVPQSLQVNEPGRTLWAKASVRFR